MTTRYETSHFVSKGAALAYYLDYYGNSADAAIAAVNGKLENGEIHLGAPPLKPGERLTTIDDGRRYAIEES